MSIYFFDFFEIIIFTKSKSNGILTSSGGINMELTFGEKIRNARKIKNFTQKQLAEKIGAKHNSISDWENNKNKPDPDTIELLCGILELTPNYLLAASPSEFSPVEKLLIERYRLLDDFGKNHIDYELNRELDRMKQIKNLSELHYASTTPLRIYTYMHKLASAGIGFYFDDIPTETIEAPYVDGADFIIGVNGDSMKPTYCDGDMVYVRKQQIVSTGEIGIFMFNNQCLIKEAGEEGLISHNPEYKFIPGSENIICIGKVLGKVPSC